jgi:uncharacterized protein YbbK (DUF523 family)
MKKRLPQHLQEWVDARQRYHLSHAHVQMARELGFAAKSLRELVASDLQPWKLPMRAYLEELYVKRLGRERPEHVVPIEKSARIQEQKRAAKRAARRERRAAAAALRQADAVPADGSAPRVEDLRTPRDAPDRVADACRTGLTFWPATRADAPALARMRYTFRASLGHPVEVEARFVERCKAWMKNRLRQAGAWRCWLAEEDGAGRPALAAGGREGPQPGRRAGALRLRHERLRRAACARTGHRGLPRRRGGRVVSRAGPRVRRAVADAGEPVALRAPRLRAGPGADGSAPGATLDTPPFHLLEPLATAPGPAPVRVLVSACLLGEKVRYHGGDAASHHPALSRWIAEGRVVPFCPEVAGGLGVPRPPAEIQGGDGAGVLDATARVVTRDGDEVTAAFLAGAAAARETASGQGARIAILRLARVAPTEDAS